MSRQARISLPGYPHHVIQRGNNRQAIFATDADRRDMLNLLLEASRLHNVAIHSYVLMSNHLHMLASPSTDDGLSLMMQQMGRSYVPRYNLRQGRSGTLFEGRYRSTLVQTERYLLACMAYIDLNPVRCGLVAQPQDYPWSSYAHYAGMRADPLVTPHAHFWNLGNTPFAREAAYTALVQAGLAADLQQRITTSLLKNHALGDDGFVTGLELQTQRTLRPARRGRPFKALEA